MSEGERIQAGESRPDRFGLSVVATAGEGVSDEILDRVKKAWTTIAQWGRWSDGEDAASDVEDDRRFLAQLPVWLTTALAAEDTEAWLDEVLEREWTWWGSSTQEDHVKIDISAESMPVSTWPLSLVILAAGGYDVKTVDWYAT